MSVPQESFGVVGQASCLSHKLLKRTFAFLSMVGVKKSAQDDENLVPLPAKGHDYGDQYEGLF